VPVEAKPAIFSLVSNKNLPSIVRTRKILIDSACERLCSYFWTDPSILCFREIEKKPSSTPEWECLIRVLEG
jgi:hypothetical protein